MPRRFPLRITGKYFSGIPTAAEWQQITTIKTWKYTHSRTNALLLAIDGALVNFYKSEETPFNWEQETQEARNTHERITALNLLDIAKKCALWLESKKDSKKSNRRKKVTNLLMETQKALQTIKLKFDFSQTLRHKDGKAMKQSEIFGSMAARLRWQGVKIGIKRLGIGKNKKALDSPYWAETNIGGANPHNLQGHVINQEWNASNEKYLFNFTRKRVAKKGKGSRVKYVKEADRWKYELLFDEKGRMHKKLDRHSKTTELKTLINTGTSAWLFIIDSKKNCYLSMGEGKTAEGDGFLFHHSSIMSGEAVLFAGAAIVVAGELTEIDNASGHYKPGKEHLVNALTVLDKKKVRLDRAKVVYMAGMRKIHNMEVPQFEIYNNAKKFLTSKGKLKPDRTT